MAPLVAGPYPWVLLVLLATPLAVPPARRVSAGASGRDLIPVLGATGRLELAVAVVLTVALVLA